MAVFQTETLPHHYSHYGIRVHSDLALPELLVPRRDDKGQIVVRHGDYETDAIVAATEQNSFLRVEADVLHLNIEGIVHLAAVGGEELIYFPAVGIDDDTVRAFLFGSGIAALLMQRGLLVLHGNAIVGAGGCVLCVGESGAGKSTVAAGMMVQGAGVIADDICPIDQEFRVVPGMPRIKLWRDSAEDLGIYTEDLKRIRPDFDKFNLPLGGSYIEKRVPVCAVVLLEYCDETGIKVEYLSGGEKILALKQHTFRPGFISAMDLDVLNFEQIVGLASRIPVIRLARPKSRDSKSEVHAAVELICSDVDVYR